MNFLLEGFRKLSSDRHTNRQTDRNGWNNIGYHAASRVISK